MEDDEIKEFLECQLPEVDNWRYNILQLTQLLKKDSQSPIFNSSPWTVVEKLRSEGHSAIYRTIIYVCLIYHTEKGRVPEDSEGLHVGRPSIIDDSIEYKLRGKVIKNWGDTQFTRKMLWWTL